MAAGSKKTIRILLIVLAAGAYLFFFIRNNFRDTAQNNKPVKPEAVYTFEGITGPAPCPVPAPKHPSSWRHYQYPSKSGIAVLLTDTNSAWLGLVHGFKSFGIPFTLCTSADSALQHKLVFVYPVISGKAMTASDLGKLSRFLTAGGTIIGTNVLGGMTDDFGIGEAVPSRKNFTVKMNDTASSLLGGFSSPREREISLGSEKDFHETIGTYSYSHPQTNPLLVYGNGEACMTQYYYKDGGKAFALGIDAGEYILRAQAERGYNAERSYVNSYEPSMDVLVRLIGNIYAASDPDAVFLNTVPQNKSLAVCITHDIDFTHSIVNAVQYAQAEKAKQVKATYFIQTKYVKDWNDDLFFNAAGAGCVKKIAAEGMEIASHSVAHSHVFSSFPEGDGTETYPSYVPVVLGRDSAAGGTVSGELRVSKFLLEKMTGCEPVVSFRPGHLSYPFCLPQWLEATGYRYSSSVTANSVLTHLPFRLQYNREDEEELSIYEFPVTIEDEEAPRLDLRLGNALRLADQLGQYGGFMNVLIHTDTLAYKLQFEEQLIDSLRGKAWFGTLREYAGWWVARDAVHWTVSSNAQEKTIHLFANGIAADQSITVPAGWSCTDKDVQQEGNIVFIPRIGGSLDLHFTTGGKS